MSLGQLAEEYRRSTDKLAQRLSQLRLEQLEARGEAALDLERRIGVMALELADLRSLAQYLRDYYA